MTVPNSESTNDYLVFLLALCPHTATWNMGATFQGLWITMLKLHRSLDIRKWGIFPWMVFFVMNFLYEFSFNVKCWRVVYSLTLPAHFIEHQSGAAELGAQVTTYQWPFTIRDFRNLLKIYASGRILPRNHTSKWDDAKSGDFRALS